uniref:ATP synthase mitochondrial F1 complex assembly factor 1 n=1 Tax=Grammatophora oceanica TaxID=210454 RepID=A0A7S1UVE6_9STRA|mmetsp:Transcript_22294/g.33192  ORF Transcript_22294/g.33192 Transcript_22294/m.33192 type:complete len:226 (+) Transcript_22294:130-807(+)
MHLAVKRCLSSYPCAFWGSFVRSVERPSHVSRSSRSLSFSFAGPRKLNDIVKKELIDEKTSSEIADIWLTFHETKENSHGLILKGKEAEKILSRAKACPFFIQPVFREGGHFNLVSQFQGPCYFLMAYLEDYQMDPRAATPLLTFSIFDDYSTTKDLTMVRCDVINKGIADDEGLKIVHSMLDAYRKDSEYKTVEAFNKTPDSFDLDSFLSQQEKQWKNPPSVSE